MWCVRWLIRTKHFPESKNTSQNPKTFPRIKNTSQNLDSGKCLWILGRVLDSEKCFWILGSILDSEKCFWILGSVLSLRATVDVLSRLTRHLGFCGTFSLQSRKRFSFIYTPGPLMNCLLNPLSVFTLSEPAKRAWIWPGRPKQITKIAVLESHNISR